MPAIQAPVIDLTTSPSSSNTADTSSRRNLRRSISFILRGPQVIPMERPEPRMATHQQLIPIQSIRRGLGDQEEEPILISSDSEGEGDEEGPIAGPSTGGLMLPGPGGARARRLERGALRSERERRRNSEINRLLRGRQERAGNHPHTNNEDLDLFGDSDVEIVDAAPAPPPIPMPQARPPARRPGLGGAILSIRGPNVAQAAEGGLARQFAHHILQYNLRRPGGGFGALYELLGIGGTREDLVEQLQAIDALRQQEKKLSYSPKLTHPSYPLSRPGFSYDFGPSSADVIGSSSTEEAEAPTFVCVRCVDPLFLGQSGDEKIWALRCGHVLCAKCLSLIGKPPRDAEEAIPSLPTAKLIPMPVPARREGLRPRGTVNGTGSAATSPAKPSAAKGKRVKKERLVKAKVHKKEFMFTCPVATCAMEHTSVKEVVEGKENVEGGLMEGWKPRERDGPVEIYA